MKHRQHDNALRFSNIKHAIGKLPDAHTPDVPVDNGMAQRVLRRNRCGPANRSHESGTQSHTIRFDPQCRLIKFAAPQS